MRACRRSSPTLLLWTATTRATASTRSTTPRPLADAIPLQRASRNVARARATARPEAAFRPARARGRCRWRRFLRCKARAAAAPTPCVIAARASRPPLVPAAAEGPRARRFEDHNVMVNPAGIESLWEVPRIPASAGALIFDGTGRLLILKPSYKTGWTIPGGQIEENGESPWEGCQRETLEECGLEIERGRLACVDFLRPRPGRPGGVRFLFDCGPSAISSWRRSPSTATRSTSTALPSCPRPPRFSVAQCDAGFWRPSIASAASISRRGGASRACAADADHIHPPIHLMAGDSPLDHTCSEPGRHCVHF